MKKYIYKIENLINHKVYIGQTNNLNRRFAEHKSMSQDKKNKILYMAFKKYGIENFSFEEIEYVENYNEREKFWIAYYDSYNNGYNMTEGGEEPPIFHKENHHLATHNQSEIDYIIDLLANTTLSTGDIAQITKYNTSSINRINLGQLWYDETLTYPIRTMQAYEGKEQRAKKIKNDLLNTNLTQKEIAKKYNVGRTTITAINNGKNFFEENLNYPLRKKPVETISSQMESKAPIDTGLEMGFSRSE